MSVIFTFIVEMTYGIFFSQSKALLASESVKQNIIFVIYSVF